MIVADYFYKEVIFQKETTFLLNFWDTNGKERSSKGLPNNLYRNCNGIILVCSYDKKESYETLQLWLDFIKSNTMNRQVPIILLANKSNLPKDKKVVSAIDIIRFAEINRIPLLDITSECKSIEEGINLCINILAGNPYNFNVTSTNVRAPVRNSIKVEQRSRSASFVVPPKKNCC